MDGKKPTAQTDKKGILTRRTREQFLAKHFPNCPKDILVDCERQWVSDLLQVQRQATLEEIASLVDPQHYKVHHEFHLRANKSKCWCERCQDARKAAKSILPILSAHHEKELNVAVKTAVAHYALSAEKEKQEAVEKARKEGFEKGIKHAADLTAQYVEGWKQEARVEERKAILEQVATFSPHIAELVSNLEALKSEQPKIPPCAQPDSQCADDVRAGKAPPCKSCHGEQPGGE